MRRSHAAGDLVQLYNVSEDWQRCDAEALGTGRALEEMKRLRNVLTSMY